MRKSSRSRSPSFWPPVPRRVWVVRLSGPRRVEVHESGQEPRLVRPGEELTAPGILQNPVPVNALYDRQAAHAVTFRNLLQRQGYRDLDEVRDEGRTKDGRRGNCKPCETPSSPSSRLAA